MRKIYPLILLFILFAFCAESQKPPIQLSWLNSAQEYFNGGDFEAKAVTNLSDGSVIVVGYFTHTVDFDPGPDTFTVSTKSYYALFMARYSNQGKLIFAYGFDGGGQETSQSVNAVTADANDNIYITGNFNGDIDFDPGTGKTILSCPASVNNFLACYTKSGEFKFAKNITATTGGQYEYSNSLVLDKNKNIYIAGSFEGFDVDFDPGPNATHSYSNETDIFFSKYDSAGNFKFVKILGGKFNDYANKIALDKNNNIIICGSFYSTYADFDPDSAKYVLTKIAGEDGDLFFAKYDTTGKLIFAKNVGNYKSNEANSIAVGTDNSFVLTGNFYGTSVDFDPTNPGMHLLTSQNSNDAFVAKYDADGNCIFAFAIGNASARDQGIDIGLDSNNNIFCTGDFGGKSVDFDPGIGEYKISTSKTGYYYLAKYTYAGNIISAVAIGGGVSGPYYNDFEIHSLHVTQTGKTLLAGYFTGKIDLDAGPDSTIVNTPTSTMFVCKYDNANNFLSEINGDNYFSYYTNTEVHSSAIDKAGNMYVCGSFTGCFDFDSGPGKYILESFSDSITSDYESAGFFAKYSAQGKLIFAKVIKGGQVDVNDIAVDDNKNIYLAGKATAYTDFDPGNSVYYLNNDTAKIYEYYAFFFARYDANGNLVFAKGGSNGQSYFLSVTSIALDNKNAICIAGTLDYSMDFDPGPGEHIIKGDNGGLGNIFIAKYDSLGNYVFAYCVKSNNSSGGVTDLKFDNTNNIIFSGTFFGTNLDFDPGAGKFLLSSTNPNYFSGFISKYKNNGSFISAIAIDGQNYTQGHFASLTTDKAGNIYIAGSSTNVSDFDPGPGIASLTNAYEIFFASYNNKLQFRFLKGLPSNDDDYAEGNNVNAICLDKYSNIYLAGEYSTSYIDCNPGIDTALLINDNYTNSNNLFIAKYDSVGNYIYSNQFNNDSAVSGNISASIAVDNKGILYYSGSAKSKINFATGNKKVYLEPTSNYDNMFVTQYKQTGFQLSTSNAIATTKPELNNTIKVYPNPIKDHITIQLNNIKQNNSMATISLFDMNGKCLQTNQSYFSNHNLNTTIKLPQNLSAGNYFITIDVEGKTYYSNVLIK